MTILIRILGSIYFLLLIGCSNEQIISKNVERSDLDTSLQTWVQTKSKENGIYLKKMNENKDQSEKIRYLIYSKKDLSYDYRTIRLDLKDGTLSIYLKDKMAPDEQYMKTESHFIITLDSPPEKIEMYLNEKTVNYQMEQP
ncbi:hypothetical protein GC102_15760 [Paenibacillus sp. LMG 31460]|uniref:Lipoprotein n=1 Tax=Paenibacillus germinis TaxID=2654979 RepID=A0ABX1Z5T0_9BACL|nr:hypothetical protein [Paenibacillus germinis]NOU87230.1 hypothetical protein [Paenibacillus germinis]